MYLKYWSYTNLLLFLLFRFLKKIGFKSIDIKKFNREDRRYKQIINDKFDVTCISKKYLSLKIFNNKEVRLRRFSSDLDVFNQVIVNNSYLQFIDLIKKNNINVSTIIDAGANIGLSGIVFNYSFSNASLIFVEASNENYKCLEYNLKINKIDSICYNAALWDKNTNLTLNKEFGDKQHWAHSVIESNNKINSIKAITLRNLIENHQLKSIDILKIDIEGGEFNLFNDSDFIACLNIVKSIAIELHDSAGDINLILSKLKNLGFNISKIDDFYACFKL